MNINFFYAKQKHRMWKIRVKAYLLDLQEIAENSIADHHQCDLGKWMDGYALDQLKDLAEIHELDEVHRKVHETVKIIVKLKNEGKIVDARTEFIQLEKHSDSVIKILNGLEAKLLLTE